MDIFITLIMVMVSWRFAYVQTHQIVYIKYLEFFVYQLHLNKAVEKAARLFKKGAFLG